MSFKRKSSNSTLVKSFKKFNEDPTRGINYLLSQNLIDESSDSIANFIYRHKENGLNKTKIGEYFGENCEFVKRVLKDFVELHDFKNLPFNGIKRGQSTFLETLREFLWSFRLPGNYEIK